MRTEWICTEEMSHILAALTYENRLACQVSLRTGLRIGDVLSLTRRNIFGNSGRFTIKEQKTGKSRRVYIPKDLLENLRGICGRYYVFSNRFNEREHRTRQAVFKDLKRAAKAFRIHSNVAPHSLRKIFAVSWFEKTQSIEKVRELLGHSSEAVTMLYAMANVVNLRRKKLRLDNLKKA